MVEQMSALQIFFLVVYLLGVLVSSYISSIAILEYYREDREIPKSTADRLIEYPIYLFVWVLLIGFSWTGALTSILYLFKRIGEGKC